ncbi:NIPSNAP family protein [Nonomuraea pusilla]|uniref:NIPSNAP family protein n=1 Tax=Nonomuraea pusilla TaxID=46177 RepID=UPI0033259AAB
MIYELRRYTLFPGARETLIELFEREFVETQEETGIRVVGTFRDQDGPDVFPWIRAFPDMESRRASLTAFYTGPAWLAHRDAANATMIDSDDVLLLRPVPGSPGLTAAERPPAGSGEPPSSLYVATVHHVEPGGSGRFAELFAREAAPALTVGGVTPVAWLESEHAENTFPRLPVREDANVFVWFARFERPEDEREVELPMLDGLATAAPDRFRLRPTTRSALR